MTRIKDCLCHQYEQLALSTLTDQLIATMGNIENALLQSGASPRGCYDHLDLAKLAMQFICNNSQLQITLEDIRPATPDTDPLCDCLATALKGLNEVTISEAASAAGIGAPSRPLRTRIGMSLKKLGWARYSYKNGEACYQRSQS